MKINRKKVIICITICILIINVIVICTVRKENNPKEQTTVRLPLELKERIQKEADRKGMSFNELVLIILNDWITPEK